MTQYYTSLTIYFVLIAGLFVPRFTGDAVDNNSVLPAENASIFTFFTDFESENRVSVSLIPEVLDIAGIDSFRIGLRMDIEKGWHVYWRNPGDSGLPTEIRWLEHGPFQPGDILWPVPSRFDEEGVTTYGYSDSVTLLIPFTPDNQLTDGSSGTESLTFSADVHWLVCKDICIPESATVALTTDEDGRFVAYTESGSEHLARVDRLLPLAGSDWRAEGGFTDDRLVIRLTPKSDDAVIPSTDDIYFFPYRQGLIDHTAPQKIIRIKNKLVIETLPSRYRRPGIREAAGIVVAGDSWTRSGSRNAIEVRFIPD